VLNSPITSTSPANEFWGIDQSITYGTTSILSTTAGIVDTGTTLTLIATGKLSTDLHSTPRANDRVIDALSKYQRATGAVADSTTGLLRLTTAQFNALQNLNFKIGSTTFTLTPNAQIWPVSDECVHYHLIALKCTPCSQRSLNSFIGGNSNSVYLIVGDLGSNSGEGLDFINGQTFLERFYSVFGESHSLFKHCWATLTALFRDVLQIPLTSVSVWRRHRSPPPLLTNWRRSVAGAHREGRYARPHNVLLECDK
jgi:hypothetical protein